MRIEVKGTTFAAKYDFDDLNGIGDWFILTPRTKDQEVNGKFYLGPAFPLYSMGREGGSYVSLLSQNVSVASLTEDYDVIGN